MQQFNLFGGSVLVEDRGEYIPPNYLKFYTIYQYDRLKFKELLRKAREENPPKNDFENGILQKKILKQCYVKDKFGNKIIFSDERHIFRYPTLFKIYMAIYNQLAINPLEDFEFKESEGLIIFKSKYTRENYQYRGQTFGGQDFIEYGAEIKGTWALPLRERVIIHIRLLRMLKDNQHIYSRLASILSHTGFVIEKEGKNE